MRLVDLTFCRCRCAWSGLFLSSLTLFFVSELLIASTISSARRLPVFINTMDNGKMSPVIISLIELIATMCTAELFYHELWSLGLFESCLFYLWHFSDEMHSVRQLWNE